MGSTQKKNYFTCEKLLGEALLKLVSVWIENDSSKGKTTEIIVMWDSCRRNPRKWLDYRVYPLVHAMFVFDNGMFTLCECLSVPESPTPMLLLTSTLLSLSLSHRNRCLHLLAAALWGQCDCVNSLASDSADVRRRRRWLNPSLPVTITMRRSWQRFGFFVADTIFMTHAHSAELHYAAHSFTKKTLSFYGVLHRVSLRSEIWIFKKDIRY